jgi:hypothetical protein
MRKGDVLRREKPACIDLFGQTISGRPKVQKVVRGQVQEPPFLRMVLIAISPQALPE